MASRSPIENALTFPHTKIVPPTTEIPHTLSIFVVSCSLVVVCRSLVVRLLDIPFGPAWSISPPIQERSSPTRRCVLSLTAPPPLPQVILIRWTNALILSCVLTQVPSRLLAVLHLVVLSTVWLTLVLDKPESVATATLRRCLAFRLPVEIRITLPVLTLNAILTRGIFVGVGPTFCSRNCLSSPPLSVNRCLFRSIPTLIDARKPLVAANIPSNCAGTAAPWLTSPAEIFFIALTESESGAILTRTTLVVRDFVTSVLLSPLFRIVVFSVIYLLGPKPCEGLPFASWCILLNIVGIWAELFIRSITFRLVVATFVLESVRRIGLVACLTRLTASLLNPVCASATLTRPGLFPIAMTNGRPTFAAEEEDNIPPVPLVLLCMCRTVAVLPCRLICLACRNLDIRHLATCVLKLLLLRRPLFVAVSILTRPLLTLTIDMLNALLLRLHIRTPRGLLRLSLHVSVVDAGLPTT